MRVALSNSQTSASLTAWSVTRTSSGRPASCIGPDVVNGTSGRKSLLASIVVMKI